MFNNSVIAEGTVLTRVTLCVAGNFASWSTFSTKMTLPPQTRGKNNSKIDKSKQMEVEAKTPSNWLSGKTVFAQCKKATTLRCSIATPLGNPVEPDVYKT